MIPTTMTMVGSAVEFEADGEALDDVGAVARLAGPGDRLDRAIVGAGVIFGDPDDQRGDGKADVTRQMRSCREAGAAGGR